MTTERDEIEEMFAAYKRQNERLGRQRELLREPQQRKRGGSQFRRKVRALWLTLVADAVLAGMLVWLLFAHTSDGLDVAALATTGVLILGHVATVVWRLVELRKHDPATTCPDEMLKFRLKTEEKQNKPVTVLSRKVTIVAATVALLAISIIPVYEGRTMSGMRLGERAAVIENIDIILEGRGLASVGHWPMLSRGLFNIFN